MGYRLVLTKGTTIAACSVVVFYSRLVLLGREGLLPFSRSSIGFTAFVSAAAAGSAGGDTGYEAVFYISSLYKRATKQII